MGKIKATRPKILDMELLEKIIRQNTIAEYVLGEVEQHLEKRIEIDNGFRFWFKRNLDKYRKGEKVGNEKGQT
jgi:hypothetical protein